MRNLIVAGLLGLAVSGCGGSGGSGAPAAPAAPAATTAPGRAAPPSRTPATPSRTSTRPTTPRPTTPPATVDGVCPYADAITIAETVGQRISRTTVTQTRPHVGCAYYRSNGEKAVEVSVSLMASPLGAQTRALEIAGRAANPVDGVGDGGAVSVGDAGSVLAVSKGRALVVVRINQRVSLEAVEIAKLVVAKI